MDTLIQFGEDTLFRFSFVIMVLGLGRILFIAIVKGLTTPGTNGAISRNSLRDELKLQLRLVGRLWQRRSLWSLATSVVHTGILLVPLFLAAHVQMWHLGAGFSWFSLPQHYADILSLIVITGLPAIYIIRYFTGFREFRGKLLIILIPFVSGYFAVNIAESAIAYQRWMVFHVYSGNLLMVLLPFTSLARCILDPIAQLSLVFGRRIRSLIINTEIQPVGEEQ